LSIHQLRLDSFGGQAAAATPGVAQPLTLSARLQDRAAMRQPVERRAGQPLAAQHLRALRASV
jgi:hypothetical protein